MSFLEKTIKDQGIIINLAKTKLSVRKSGNLNSQLINIIISCEACHWKISKAYIVWERLLYVVEVLCERMSLVTVLAELEERANDYKVYDTAVIDRTECIQISSENKQCGTQIPCDI